MTDQQTTQPGTAAAKKTEIVAFREQLTGRSDAFARRLPKHIDPAKFESAVYTAVDGNRDLLNADRASLFTECMKAASDGLIIDGREAAMTVYNTKQKDGSYKKMAKYIPMYQGLLKKARNSGEIASFRARVVYEKDAFEYEMGDDERLMHKPYLEGAAGPMKFVYMICVLKNGEIIREVMSRAQVEEIKKRSRPKDSGPWVTDEAEMWRKTVIRRGTKYVPQSTDKEGQPTLHDLVHRDDDLYEPTTGEVIEPDVAEPPRRRGRRPAAEALNQDPPPQEPPQTGDDLLGDLPPHLRGDQMDTDDV